MAYAALIKSISTYLFKNAWNSATKKALLFKLRNEFGLKQSDFPNSFEGIYRFSLIEFTSHLNEKFKNYKYKM